MDNTNNNSRVSEGQDATKYDDDFSLADIITILKESQKVILLTTLSFFLVSSIYIFSQPNQYASSSLLALVEDSDAGGSGFGDIASRYGGLASVAGVAISKGSSTKSNLVIATIKSRDFFEYLSNIPEIYPFLVASKRYNESSKILELDENIYNSKKMTWVNGKPSTLEAHLDFLSNMTLSKDKRTEFIYLSFKHISPEFAFRMTKTIISEANNVIRQEHLEESQKSISYLNAALINTSAIATKSSITTLLDAQLKVQMIANVRKEYVIRAIDKPYLPEWKAGPSRLKFIILSSLAGMLISAFFAMYLHYFRGTK